MPASLSSDNSAVAEPVLDVIFPAAPSPTTMSIADAYARPRQPHPSRPWVMMCMVTSVDGAAVVDGTSRALSSVADQRVLAATRTHADLILIGAQTMRAEGYGPPRHPGQRVAIVTRSAAGLDVAAPLFTSGRGLLIMPMDGPDVPVETVRAGYGTVDLADALTQLATQGVDIAQCEGGPALNGAMVAADLVDEFNLTTAPLIAGSDSPRLTAGAPLLLNRLRLANMYHLDGFVFSRYLRDPMR